MRKVIFGILGIVVLVTLVGCGISHNLKIDPSWEKMIFTGDNIGQIGNQVDKELCPQVMSDKCSKVEGYYDINGLKQGLRISYVKGLGFGFLTKEQREKIKNTKDIKYAEAYFKNNKIESIKKRGSDGKLQVEGNYKDGEKEGIWKFGDIENDNLKEEGKFKNGEKVGIWKIGRWKEGKYDKIEGIDCDNDKAKRYISGEYGKRDECYIFGGLSL